MQVKLLRGDNKLFTPGTAYSACMKIELHVHLSGTGDPVEGGKTLLEMLELACEPHTVVEVHASMMADEDEGVSNGKTTGANIPVQRGP